MASSRKPQFHFPATGDHLPEDKDQRWVQTPYGPGLVIRTRPSDNHNDMQEIDLFCHDEWERTLRVAQNKGHDVPLEEEEPTKNTANIKTGPHRPTRLYTVQSYPSVRPQVGHDVSTLYGRGRVTSTDHGVVVVTLSSWRLAGRSRVTCYLRGDCDAALPTDIEDDDTHHQSTATTSSRINVLRPKRIYEMTVAEKLDYGQALKQAATQQFTQHHNYRRALHLYSTAVDAVRYVQHATTNSKNKNNTPTDDTQRSDLVVLLITCHNNAATCCTHLSMPDETLQRAKSALILLQALEEKKGGRVHQQLLRDGYSDTKVFGEWQCKSFLVTAQAMMAKAEPTKALETLQLARGLIQKISTTTSANNNNNNTSALTKTLRAQNKEIARLHAAAKELKRVQTEKERRRAQAMFVSKPATNDHKSNDDDVNHNDGDDDNEDKDRQPPLQPTNDDTTTSPKKRVSFSNRVQVQQDRGSPLVPPLSTIVPLNNNNNHDDELEWYDDPEVVQGLALFAGTVVATMAGLWYYLSPARQSKS